jgi:hypothetical protein
MITEIPELRIAKLELHLGDCLVIRAPIYITRPEIQSIYTEVKKQLPDGVGVLVIGPNVELSAITLVETKGKQ